jgi:uncharacterized protein
MRIETERLEFMSLGSRMASMLFLPESRLPAPALIMCHGAMDFKENYFPFCTFLAQKGIAALAVDMHGYGESEGNRYHVVMEEWVADIRAALLALQAHPGIDGARVGAFGVSSGGTAVLECSLVEPGIRALITLDATIRPVYSLPERIGTGILSIAGRIKKLLTGTGLRVSLVSACKKMELASDPEVNTAWHSNPRVLRMWESFPFPGFEESSEVDTYRRVHDIRVPTLVLHGEDDKVDKPESARLLYSLLTCTKGLHIIEGNGHLGHLDRNRDKVMELTARWVLKHLG